MAKRRSKTRTVVRYKSRPRRSGASPALKKAQGQLVNLRSRLRKKGSTSGVQAVGKDFKTAAKLAVSVNAGAGIAGAINVYQPTVAGIDTRLVAGSALIAAGAMMLKGDMAAMAVCAGSGILAGYTQDSVQAMLESADSVVE